MNFMHDEGCADSSTDFQFFIKSMGNGAASYHGASLPVGQIQNPNSPPSMFGSHQMPPMHQGASPPSAFSIAHYIAGNAGNGNLLMNHNAGGFL